jgi:thymidylate kinase
MKYKNFAILGVDGSGKSTLIKELANKFGNKCVITYMGSRSYEDDRLETLLKKKKCTRLEFYEIIIRRYICFWKRYINSIRSRRIVLYDRYVHEIYINSSEHYKLLYTILYKYLYPSPKYTIYLYCSVEESLRRKNDIPDPIEFRKMKERFDNVFLHDRKCLCLSSEEYTPEELAEISYTFISSKL